MAFNPAPGAYYYLVAAHSHKVLEIKDASKDNGAILQQGELQPYLESDHQQFAFNGGGEPRVFALRARHSSLVLDVDYASRDDMAKVHQFGWNGVDHQRFRAIDAGDGTVFLEAVHSGKVLEIYGEEKGAGKPAKQYRNHHNGKNAHQRFRPVVADPSFTAKSLPGFTNPSQMVRDATLGIAGLIPTAGGAIKGVVGLLWPDGTASSVYTQIVRYIEAYVDSRLQAERIKALQQAIAGASTNLREFVECVPGSEKATKLTATITALNQADRPFFDNTAPERTLSYLVTIGTIKLTLLQEQACHYAAIAGIAADANKDAHFRSLRTGIEEYTRAAKVFRDFALNARVEQIGHNFRSDGSSANSNVILRDGGDGTETQMRPDTSGPGSVDSRAVARANLYRARVATVRAQFGAQLDAIIAPALMWQSFDPEKKRPQTRKISATVGPIGTPRNVVKMVDGDPIYAIEIWTDDQKVKGKVYTQVRGMRVSSAAGGGKSTMLGIQRGTVHLLELKDGEFIVGVYGSAYHYVHSIHLETNFGRRIQAGQRNIAYRYNADLPPELSARLVAISASEGHHELSSIAFHWEYELHGEPSAFRFQSEPEAAGDTPAAIEAP